MGDNTFKIVEALIEAREEIQHYKDKADELRRLINKAEIDHADYEAKYYKPGDRKLKANASIDSQDIRAMFGWEPCSEVKDILASTAEKEEVE